MGTRLNLRDASEVVPKLSAGLLHLATLAVVVDRQLDTTVGLLLLCWLVGGIVVQLASTVLLKDAKKTGVVDVCCVAIPAALVAVAIFARVELMIVVAAIVQFLLVLRLFDVAVDTHEQGQYQLPCL